MNRKIITRAVLDMETGEMIERRFISLYEGPVDEAAITMGNQQELEFQLRVAGALSASANHVDAFISPLTGYVRAIFAELGTAGSGGNTTADIQDNGTSLWGANAPGLTFASAATAPTYATLPTNPPAVTKGDVFTLTVPATTGSPKDLVILVVLSKRPVAALETQTLGADFDAAN